MTLLLECREKIKRFYRMNSVVILPVLKFLVAFIALNGVNTMMGYMPKLDNIAIVLIASLACSFLPAGILTLLCAAFSMAHMYSLSLEVAIIGFCLYLVLFLMLLRFAPKDSYVVILTPLLFALKIPYVVPIAVGLTATPISAISVACGVIVYYFLTMVVGCAPVIRSMGDDLVEKLRYLIETVAGNKTVLVIAAAFSVTVVVVYLIRRMSVEYAWTIAMVAGAMVNLVLLLLGDLLYDIQFSIGSAIWGSVVAILIAKVIEFFRFCVDHSRMERVQFEDDEYYYYVKAVPKMNVAASTKTVKKINAQSVPARSAAAEGSPAGTGRAGRPRPQAARTTVQEAVQEPIRESLRTDRADTYRQEMFGQTQTLPRPSQSGGVRTSARAGANMTSGSGSYGAAVRSAATERAARPLQTEGAQSRPGSYASNQGAAVRNVPSADDFDDSDDYEELF